MDLGLSADVADFRGSHERAELSAILECLPHAVLVVDRQLEVQFANRAARHLADRSKGEMVGLQLASALRCCGCTTGNGDTADAQCDANATCTGRCALERAVLNTLETGVGVHHVQIDLELGDGEPSERTTHILHTSSVVVRGESSAILCLQRGSESSTLRAELYHTQRMATLGQLARGAVHDLNNVLAVVLCYVDIAAAALPKGSPIHNDLEQIGQAGQSAAVLTRQLLNLSRKRGGIAERTDVNAVVIAMEKMLRRPLGVDIEIVSSLESSLPPILIVPGHLEQIILNLAVNARDAMPDGGTLTLRTGRVRIDRSEPDGLGLACGDYVELEVADTGAGIDPAIVSRVFEPFFTTKGSATSAGLGLSTVSRIVAQAGGSIAVESRLGQGTTFNVLLPQAPPGKDTQRHSVAPPVDVSGSETILVVEGDHTLRRLLCRVLREHGFTVLEAANAGEAVLLCEQSRGGVDLLLTDMVMPHLSGLELARRLRGSETQLKVLYMSSHLENPSLEEALHASPSGLLEKPFKPHQLLYRIRQVLDDTSERAEARR